jgi:hypothetical protein
MNGNWRLVLVGRELEMSEIVKWEKLKLVIPVIRTTASKNNKFDNVGQMQTNYELIEK